MENRCPWERERWLFVSLKMESFDGVFVPHKSTLKQGKFQLNTVKRYFTTRVVKHWRSLLNVIESLSLDGHTTTSWDGITEKMRG